ncbi:MAG: type 4a pilus biogenesis protein PilO [Bacillota bacterium]|nr:type 4a pilus biogenesis protein PilO [Bacillota bacterium]
MRPVEGLRRTNGLKRRAGALLVPLLLALPVLLWVSSWMAALWAEKSNLEKLQKEVQALRQGLAEFRATREELLRAEQKVGELESRLLPPEKFSLLFAHLEEACSLANLSLERLETTGAPTVTPDYAEWPLAVRVKGRVRDILRLSASLHAFPYLVRLQGMRIEAPGGTAEAGAEARLELSLFSPPLREVTAGE